MDKSTIPYFFYHECDKCGLCDEAMIHWSGPHIKLTCQGCNKYIKFIGRKSLPTKIQLKKIIFQICNENLNQIESFKQELNFKVKKEGSIEQFQQYWKLYLLVRSKVNLTN